MPSDFTAGRPDADELYDRTTAAGKLATTGDPDLDDLDNEASTDLDDLAAELNADVAPTTTIAVTGRPGYAVRFRTDFTGKDLDSLRKRAKNKRMSDGIDGIKFAALLLAFTCQGITRAGRELAEDLDTKGPVTFTTRELQELIGTADADSTVRKFYGLEGHVDAAARRLMVEAGWGDEVDAMDPTE